MFGRVLKISIAKDNGRSVEFNKKRTYPDMQRCFECGQDGHISFKCPLNVLGHREVPPQKSTYRYKNPNEISKSETEQCDGYNGHGAGDGCENVYILFMHL